VFNQSVYTLPEGFTNSLLATLNAQDIIAYKGEGDYLLILGAVDMAGNRTNSNYLNDSNVKIKITGSTASTTTSTSTPVTTPTPTSDPAPAPVSGGGGGGGGGNGPIVNSYGAFNVNHSPASVTSPLTFIVPTTNISSKVESGGAPQESISTILADGGLPSLETTEMSDEISLSTTSNENATSSQVATAFFSGFSMSWLWLIILAIVLTGGYYYFKRNN
jgi:hypothetical protein